MLAELLLAVVHAGHELEADSEHSAATTIVTDDAETFRTGG